MCTKRNVLFWLQLHDQQQQEDSKVKLDVILISREVFWSAFYGHITIEMLIKKIYHVV